MTKVKVSHIELDYSEIGIGPPKEEPTNEAVEAWFGAALRPAEEPKKKKGFWRKFWDWVWG